MVTPVTPCSTPDTLTSGFPVPAAGGCVSDPEEEAGVWALPGGQGQALSHVPDVVCGAAHKKEENLCVDG